MLRLIIISLTVFSLLNLQLTGFGFISSAYAQAETVTATTNVDPSIQLRTDAQYKTTAEQKQEFTERMEQQMKEYKAKKAEGGLAAMFSAEGFLQILMLTSIAWVGQSIMLACPEARKQWDVLAFVAGSAAYIAGEIQAWFRYKKVEGANFKYIDGSLTGQQRQTLEGQKENYLLIQSIGKTKYTLQMAAAAAFALAAGISVKKHLLNEKGEMMCLAELKKGKAFCKEYCKGLANPAAISACEVGTANCFATAEAGQVSTEAAQKQGESPTIASIPGFATLHSAIYGKRATVKPACSVVSACAGTMEAKCAAADTMIESSWVSCKPASFISESKMLQTPATKIAVQLPKNVDEFFSTSYLTRIADKFFDLAIPKANAAVNFVELFGMSFGAIYIFVGLNKTHADWFDKWMLTPLKRAGVFGVCSGLAATSALLTKKNVDNVGKHIEEIDKILAKMGDSSNVSGLTAIDQNAKIPFVTEYSTSATGTKATTPCIMIGSVKQNCGSLTSALRNVENNSALKGITLDSFGSNVAQMTQLAAGMGDSLQGQTSLTNAAMTSAGALADKAAMAKKFMDDSFKSLDDQRKKNGLAPVNLAESNKKLLNNIQAAALKTLQAKGVNASTAVASMGLLDPVTKAEAKKEGLVNEKAMESAAVSSKSEVAVQSGLPSLGGDLIPTEEQGVNTGEVSVEKAAEGLQLDESKVGDINNAPETSIFEILTQRYFKTGLDKLGIQTKTESSKNSAAPKAP